MLSFKFCAKECIYRKEINRKEKYNNGEKNMQMSKGLRLEFDFIVDSMFQNTGDF